MSRIRVLIADDHDLVREGVRSLLAARPEIEVVGEAGNGLEAIQAVQECHPDIVLMDIAMPRLGGLEAIPEVRKVSPQTKVLMLSQYDNKEYVIRCLRAGAGGYILKTATGDELVSAIRLVHDGGLFLNTPDAPHLIQEALRSDGPRRQDPYESLTDREKQVLKLIAEGHTSKEIADLLFISVKTVITHRTNLMDKLGIHNRSQLIRYAINQGIVELSSGG